MKTNRSWEESWHFPRQDLAESWLESLGAGQVTLAIFAERKKGKTEFLLQDLAPLAKLKGFCCVYVNFWENRSDPASSLIAGVTRAMEPELGGTLRGWKKEVSVNLGVFKGKLGEKESLTANDTIKALDCLTKIKGGVLFMCDEIQHLATRPEFEDFTATLRTFIDTNKKNVRAVFTGSSRDNLNKLFRQQRAAFYNAASITPFPDMGLEFADFLSRRFQYLSKRRLDKNAIYDVFVQRHFSPAYIVELLQVMIRDGVYDLEEGIEYLEELNPADLEFEEEWSNLSLIERELLLRVAGEKTGFYSEDAYVELSAKLGVKVTKGSVQRALDNLRRKSLIHNAGRGSWRFENSKFREWLSLSHVL